MKTKCSSDVVTCDGFESAIWEAASMGQIAPQLLRPRLMVSPFTKFFSVVNVRVTNVVESTNANGMVVAL